MRVNADAGLNVEKFQQELTRTANRLSRSCEATIEQFAEICGASSRSIDTSFGAKRQKLTVWCEQAVTHLQEEKETVLRTLTVTGQAEVCKLVEIARKLQNELQVHTVSATTEMRTKLETSLQDLCDSLSAVEVELAGLREKVQEKGTRFSFDGNLSTDEQGAVDLDLVSESVIENGKISADAAVEQVATELSDNVNKRSDLIEQLRSAIQTQKELLEGHVSSDLQTDRDLLFETPALANFEKSWLNDVQAVADIVRSAHEGSMAEILQSSRMEAEELALTYEAKILGVCGLLAVARRQAEADYVNKVQQILERTEELISTEQFALQLATAEMGDKIENEDFRDMLQLYSTTKAEAARAAHASSRQLMEDFNTRVFAHLSQLEARKRELCDQLESLSKEYIERLEVQSNKFDVDLQSIRLEIEVLEQETNSWISAVSFYSASIGKLQS